jgi:hypothetical protein
MWQGIARFVRDPRRGRFSVWLTCVLLAVFMQSAGLMHRIEHGDPLYGTPASLIGDSADSSGARVYTSYQFHHAHSCVLFDGDTVFVGGPAFLRALPQVHVHPAVAVHAAHVPVHLPLVRGFMSRAPPVGFLTA